MIRYTCMVLCLMSLWSCGSKTTVILLPEDDGSVGEVVVKNKFSSTVLNKAYTYTEVEGDSSDLLSQPTDEIQIKNEYQALFDVEPMKAAHFILYFKHDSTILTEPSRALIPEILKIAKDREPSETSVIGHTDSIGKSEYNNKLAFERANIIGKILKTSGITLKNLQIKSHGENDPLIVTDDNVYEVKNRRVEIMIR